MEICYGRIEPGGIVSFPAGLKNDHVSYLYALTDAITRLQSQESDLCRRVKRLEADLRDLRVPTNFNWSA